MNSFYKDKVIWITGASSGIGEALVKELSGTGAKIVLSARREEELERVKRESRLTDSDSLCLPLDLSDSESLNRFPDLVFGKFGRVDILINNGGVSQRSLAHETDLDTYRRIMDVNFFGTVALTLAVLPHFRKRGAGHIVSVSSVAGKFGVPYRTGYSSAKAALTGFFEALRAENSSQGIHVTLVYPGFVRTKISENALNGQGKSFGLPNLKTKATISAEECAGRILKAIQNERLEVQIAGPKESFAVAFHKYFPTLFSKFLSKANVI
ncbi:SDR family oxidoreductase [Leptospira wolffii]|uniref:SDR family oxidoreductase n=1 Tax=Leptospira wolffii TaxID=409998 RepID=UPI0002F02473|nr:SDR family oxidoreductase [Leptospira wolffii]EPG67104.1 NAD(P)H-binding protein, PF13460 family [Leptospira wolffii serovar Khorat str. Khorat-H2]